MFDATVIIPTYNRAEPLRYTLESLTRQKMDGRQFEVIVSDDGSSDHTAEVVEGFRDKFPVTYLFQEDRGYRCTLARNQGIRAAKGRVCIFLDGGVVVSDRCLREHLRMYEENQNPVLVMGYVYANHGLKPEVEEQLRQLLLDYDVEEAIDRARELGFKDTRERLYRLYGD